MDVKHWAIFFVFLLSSEYVGTVVGTVVRTKRQLGCVPKPKMIQTVNSCLDRIKNQMEDPISVQDELVDDMQLTGGSVSNLNNFKLAKPVTCTCMGDRIRINIELSFIDVTVTFLVTLLDGLLGGLLGSLGRTLVRLVGNIVDLVVKLVALEINIVITVDQLLLPGSTCTVSSYRVLRVSGIKLLNIDLAPVLVPILGGVLNPLVEALVKNLFNTQVRAIITAEVEKMQITPDMYSCQG